MVAGTAGLPVSPSVSDDRQERTSVPLSESLRGAKQYHDPVRPCRSLGMYAACPCPMPSSCRRWPPTFEKHRRQLRHNIGLEVLLYMSLTARMSTHPTRDVLRLIAHSRRASAKNSVGLLSAPSSEPSPRASLLGSRNGSSTSLARIRIRE